MGITLQYEISLLNKPNIFRLGIPFLLINSQLNPAKFTKSSSKLVKEVLKNWRLYPY